MRRRWGRLRGRRPKGPSSTDPWGYWFVGHNLCGRVPVSTNCPCLNWLWSSQMLVMLESFSRSSNTLPASLLLDLIQRRASGGTCRLKHMRASLCGPASLRSMAASWSWLVSRSTGDAAILLLPASSSPTT